METFIVRLWAPPEPDEDKRVVGPSSLHGLVQSIGRRGTKLFRGGEQLLAELEAALAEPAHERATVPGAEQQLTEGT